MADHYFTKNPTSDERTSLIKVLFRQKEYSFLTSSGVFSKNKADNGSLLLIESCKPKGSILDLGCGYGLIGILLKLLFPSITMTCSDINQRAVSLAEKNAKLQNVQLRVVQSDLFSDIDEEFDTILINLPQHAGKDLCFAMIEESYEHLFVNGSLQVVSRHQRGGREYEKKMIEIFGNSDVIGRGSGYKVYMSTKK